MRDQQANAKRWSVKASAMANNTFNPIRNILETLTLTPNPDKKMISLSIGDPTVFGNLTPPEKAVEAVREAVACGRYNGYAPSTGYADARQAVADHVARTGSELSADDVVLCSGCSCALDLCISVLAGPGQNILVPRPGFPLYTTLARGLGVETREYDLLPDRDWEVDVDHMESLIDDNTVAILLNNPSNPCGSVFDAGHIRELLAVAESRRLPVIADEIYDHFVFDGSARAYTPVASLTQTVPVLSCGGLTKRFLVPGWRLGWITVHDRNGVLASGGVRRGLQCLSQRIIGANTIVQGALPTILKETPPSFYKETLALIESNARLAFEMLSRVPGLKPVMPAGAMYMMVGIDPAGFSSRFASDLELVEAMVTEQSVFCLPGKCFNVANFFRIVLTVPEDMLAEACERIGQFCLSHYAAAASPSKEAGVLLATRGLARAVAAMDEGSCSSLYSSSTEASDEHSSDSGDDAADYASFVPEPAQPLAAQPPIPTK